MLKTKLLAITLTITGMITPVLVQAQPINSTRISSTPIAVVEQAQRSPIPGDAIVQQESKWKQDYDSHFSHNFAADLMSATAISKTLQTLEKQTRGKTAVVYLIPTPKQLEVLLVTSTAKPLRQSAIPVNQDTLRATIKAFQTEIRDPKKVNTTSYIASAQQLYQWLIAPIATELQAENIDTLVFCVGAGLRSVPFSALHDGQQFLVEKYNISLIPAFSLIDTSYTDIRRASVLAMGASQFKELEPLPAVPVELSTIVQNQGGNPFLNQQFTLENLKLQRQQQPYQIVHLATHGIFQPGAVNNSYIQFWNTKLQLDQLRQLQLQTPPVNLLVLSACKTAMGDKQAELGFSGLAIAAGVKSAVGSYWSVSDAGTLALMTEFYQHLRTVPTKAEALRQAQIELLQGQVQIQAGQLRQPRGEPSTPLPPEIAKLGDINLSHPYYWAAFTMIGSPW